MKLEKPLQKIVVKFYWLAFKSVIAFSFITLLILYSLFFTPAANHSGETLAALLIVDLICLLIVILDLFFGYRIWNFYSDRIIITAPWGINIPFRVVLRDLKWFYSLSLVSNVIYFSDINAVQPFKNIGPYLFRPVIKISLKDGRQLLFSCQNFLNGETLSIIIKKHL
ncbi:MAG: hypothetical protein WCT37_02125 [Patescibacteria group bacterium]|jgi:hypothetical protein